MEPAELLTDLQDEHEALDAVLSPLSAAAWSTPTSSAGWDVADQVGHLWFFDRSAAAAIADPAAFERRRDELVAAALEEPAGLDRLTLDEARSMAPADLLDAWRTGRSELVRAAAALRRGDRVPWYGPPMGAVSFLTARLMETWAHGQDVVDAVGATRPPTDRLAHVAQLGVITRGWAYVNRGLEPPAGEVRVELTLPGGSTRSWGPDDAPASVTGPVEDFCLVVTQRRNVADTSLVVRGEAASDWMEHAQAFAGPPTGGPAPRTR